MGRVRGGEGQVLYRVPRVGQGVLWAGGPRPRYTRGRLEGLGTQHTQGPGRSRTCPWGPVGRI